MNPASGTESPVHKILSEEYTQECESGLSKILKIPLDLTPIGVEDQVVYLLENVFTDEECQELIDHTETLGYGPALVHSGDRAVLATGYRESQRVMVDDKQFSKILFRRIGKHLPQAFAYSDGTGPCRLLEINERLRFLKYKPGDFFGVHCDGSYDRPDGSASTWVTLQIYLNEDMEGGETTFLADEDPDEQLKPENRVGVTPKPGLVLVFEHAILHEGSLVTEGLKYTIRTDVLYEWLD